MNPPHIFIASLLIVLAGCIGPPSSLEDSNASSVDPNGHGSTSNENPQSNEGLLVPCSNPGNSSMCEFLAQDCHDSLIIFYVDTDHVNSLLPDGYAAEPAPQTYARAGWSTTPGGSFPAYAPTDAGVSAVGLIVHNCASASAGMGTMEESWVWVFVEPPTAGDALGLDSATFDVYEFAHAGGSNETLQRKEALGWTLYGDDTETTALESTGAGALSFAGRVTDGTKETLNLRVSGAQVTPLRGQDIFRIWHESPSGLAYSDFDTGTEGVSNYISNDFDCWMAADSPAALLTGYTSCDEAVDDTATFSPTAIINPSHDHPIMFNYHAREDSA